MADKNIAGGALNLTDGGQAVTGDKAHAIRGANSRAITFGTLAGMDTLFGGGPSGNGEIRPATIAADQNNYNPSSTANIWFLVSSVGGAGANITGIAGGVQDRLIAIKNDGLNPITFKNQSALSTAGNRLDINYDITLGAGDGMLLLYAGASSPVGDARWGCVGEYLSSMLVFNMEGQGPVTGGAKVTSKDLGIVSASPGLVTIDVAARPLQHYVNRKAHTLSPGANNGSCMVDIYNGVGAGAITTVNWNKVLGDAFDTTNQHQFRCYCSVGRAGSLLIVNAMQ